MNSMRQTLYFNGIVLTMNVDRPDVGAVLTEGERIVQVGNHQDIADHRRIRRGFKPSPRRIALPVNAEVKFPKSAEAEFPTFSVFW